MAAKQSGKNGRGDSPPRKPQPPPTQPQVQGQIDLADLKDFITKAMTKQVEELTEAMEDKLQDIRDDVNAEVKQMRKDIVIAVSGLSKIMLDLNEKIQDVHVENLELEVKVGEVENKTRKMEDDMTVMQYKNMEFAIRIRGLKENTELSLKAACTEILAALMQQDPAYIFDRIDRVYRVNSRVAIQRKLPRDVVVYFLSRSLRNDVMQASYHNKLEREGYQIEIFRELPPKMIKDRKDFSFLVDELKRQEVRFRWELPYGLSFVYDNKRHRLTSVEQARDFYEKFIKGHVTTPQSVEKKSSEIQTRIVDTLKEQDQAMAEGAVGGAMTEEDLRILEAKTIQEMIPEEEPKERRITRAAHKLQLEKEKKKQQAMLTQIPEPWDISTEAVGGARPKKTTLKDEIRLVLEKLQGAEDGN